MNFFFQVESQETGTGVPTKISKDHSNRSVHAIEQAKIIPSSTY